MDNFIKRSLKKLKNIFRYFDFRNIRTEIQGYGYEYSLGRFLQTMFVTSAIMLLMGMIYKLDIGYISVILAVMAVTMPFIIIAQYRILYQNERFEQLRNYLEYMLLNFRANPKIDTALREAEKLVSGEIKDCIAEARYRLETYTGTDFYEYALAAVEEEFPNSRLQSLHKLMIHIEKQSSGSFYAMLDNLSYDISSWIERTYVYQKELKVLKSRIRIALIFCMTVMAVFSNVYDANELIAVFTNSVGYQAITTAFVITMFMIYALCEIHLHGRWLTDDVDWMEPHDVYRKVDYVENYNPKQGRRKIWIVCVLVTIVNGLVLCFTKNYYIFLAVFIVMITIFFHRKVQYRARKKSLTELIQKEFPNWLRQVSLVLNEKVVYIAIKESLEDSHPVLQPYLYKFMDEVEKDPVSVAPYLNFLSEFKLDEVRDSMKTLYSIQKVRGDDSRQISDLMTRNQAMLEKSERMNNEDSLALIAFLSYMPSFLFSVKIILDMVMMLITVIGVLGEYR